MFNHSHIQIHIWKPGATRFCTCMKHSKQHATKIKHRKASIQAIIMQLPAQISKSQKVVLWLWLCGTGWLLGLSRIGLGCFGWCVCFLWLWLWAVSLPAEWLQPFHGNKTFTAIQSRTHRDGSVKIKLPWFKLVMDFWCIFWCSFWQGQYVENGFFDCYWEGARCKGWSLRVPSKAYHHFPYEGQNLYIIKTGSL